MLILCTPHNSYKSADLKGKPVVDVWGILENANRSARGRLGACGGGSAWMLWRPNAILTAKNTSDRPPQLDIVIPVYNEGANILSTLGALARGVQTPSRVVICYDLEEDNTLPAVRQNPDVPGRASKSCSSAITGRGAHAAVMAGFATASSAPIVVVYPADDDFNAGIIDRMAGW